MARNYPHPSKDMAEYLAHLKARMLMPYPAVYNALGLDAAAVTVEAGGREAEGYLAVRAENTLIVILVYPDGRHAIGGHINGSRLAAKTFPYEREMPGIHRGVQGKIVNYIESNVPRTTVFKVVTGLGQAETFASVEDLLAKYESCGTTTSTSLRPDLQGQPRLRGFVGPMWDGLHGGVGTVRYETQQVNDHLSR